MSIADFYDSGEHQSNLAHFAAMVNLAKADNIISTEEKKVLNRLALKLDISDEAHAAILKNPNAYPIIPPYDLETRLERIHDLFGIIYADFHIDAAEKKLIHKYAIALGFSEERARQEIQKCIRVFSNDVEFED